MTPLGDRSHIAKAAGIIMLGNIISRLLGLVREQVIVALFGLKMATDVFTVAFTVPTMVYDLLISGAISAALIPVFTDYADARDREQFSRIVSAVLSFATMALALVVALLVTFAPTLVDLLAGGFDQEARDLTTYLVRLMLPSVLFMGVAGILTATLYTRQSFTLPAFSVAVYNLGIIAGGLLLAERIQVAALAVGVLIGAALQVAIQLPGLRGLKVRPSLSLSHPGVRTILKLYAPVALGMVVSNLGVILDRNLASRTGEGSIAAMRVATTLVQFPLGLVATATSFAVLPTLSREAAAGRRRGDGETGGRGDAGTRGQGDAAKDAVPPLPPGEASPIPPLPLGEAWTGQRAGPRGEGALPVVTPIVPPGEEDGGPGRPHGAAPTGSRTHDSSLITHDSSQSSYATTLRMGMKMILVLIVPAAVGLVVLREPLVQLLFQRGAFDSSATALTALAFLGYSPGIAFAAIDQLLIFAFYARKDTRTPVLVGVAAIFVYLAVALALINPLGMMGLILANAVQTIFHALVLLWLLNRTVQGVLNRELGGFLARVVAAALVMGLACQGLLILAYPHLASGPQVALLVVVAGGLGVLVYALAVTLLRVREAQQLWTMLVGRLRRAGTSG